MSKKRTALETSAMVSAVIGPIGPSNFYTTEFERSLRKLSKIQTTEKKKNNITFKFKCQDEVYLDGKEEVTGYIKKRLIRSNGNIEYRVVIDKKCFTISEELLKLKE